MARRPRRTPEPVPPADDEDGILDLLHASLDEELDCKRQRVQRALSARGIAFDVPAPEPSPRRHGARARVSLRVGQQAELVVRRPGSHQDVPPPLDAMARPEIAAVARAIGAQLATEPRLSRPIQRLELRSDGARVVTVLYGDIPASAREPLAALLGPALGPDGALCFQARTLLGQARLRLPVGEIELEVGPLTFYQVNLEANQALVRAVGDAVASAAPTRVLDLFGGAGNLSFPIAARGIAVDLVESHPPAVKDARANAARLDLPVGVVQQDAYQLQPGSQFFDVAVLDPPRRGAGPAMEAVCATRPRAIVLVSCHPPSLAKDLQQAMSHGYRIDALSLHDLFPLTSHVESLAVLRRS